MNNDYDYGIGKVVERIGECIKAKYEETPQQLTFWADDLRAAPNCILRSALFPAIQSKSRAAFTRKVLASQSGTTIRFTGIQFNQSDLDVWEQTLHLNRGLPLGKDCEFTERAFLKAMGRSSGRSQHQWLKESLSRLQGASVEIQFQHKSYSGSLIEAYDCDLRTGRYKIVLNKKLLHLFEAGFTQVPYEKRILLRRKELALWLHSYYSSHKEPYALKVNTLRELSGSAATLNKFRENLKKALAALVKIDFFSEWSIDETDKLHVSRVRNQKALSG